MSRNVPFVDAALRLVETLRCLPIGRWRSTGQVHAELTRRGYRVSQRTVQRDLLKLAGPFGIDLEETDDIGNPYRWRRTRSLEGDGFMPETLPITQEVIDALKPKPRGVGLRIGLKT